MREEMKETETLSASLEDYLEAIFHIEARKQAARAKDIGQRLGVSRSSVTGALRALAERDLINYAPYDLITLTASGRIAAEDVVRRHQVLRDFFVRFLSVAADEAEEAACKMEHAVSRGIVERFVQFAEFMDICPRGGEGWVKGFRLFCDSGKTREDCEQCLSECLADVRRRSAGTCAALADLSPGQKGRVTEIPDDKGASARLQAAGLRSGTLIEVEGRAPDGFAVAVKTGAGRVSIDPKDADDIVVDVQ